MIKQILMCNSKYYTNASNIKYLNRRLIDYQWNNLYYNLISFGIDVKLIDISKNLTKMIFCSDAVLLCNNKALITNFTDECRIKETDYYKNYFSKKDMEVYIMNNKFNGSSNIIFDFNNNLFIGNNNSLYEIKDILNDNKNNYINLIFNTNEFNILNMCLTPLDNKIIMLYEDAFTKDSLKKIYELYDEKLCIKIDKKDALNLACNSIIIENNIGNKCLIGHKFSNSLKRVLIENGFDFIENNMSEFIKEHKSIKSTIININSF